MGPIRTMKGTERDLGILLKKRFLRYIEDMVRVSIERGDKAGKGEGERLHIVLSAKHV